MIKNIIRVGLAFVLPPLLIPVVVYGLIFLGILPDSIVEVVKENAVTIGIVGTIIGLATILAPIIVKKFSDTPDTADQ